MSLVPPSNAGVCVTLDRVTNPSAGEGALWRAPRRGQFSGLLESLSLSEPEVSGPAARSRGTWGLFLTGAP